MNGRRKNGEPSEAGTWSRQQAQRHLDAWRASGKKMKDFASDEGLEFSVLRGWAAQLSKAGRAPSGRSQKPVAAFVAVDVRRDTQASVCVSEVVLQNGLRLVLRDHVDIGAVRELVAVLGGTSC